MSAPAPLVIRDGAFGAVTGRFFRAVDRDRADAALLGSVAAARYSRPEQPTLYLGASQAGVAAALVARGGLDTSAQIVLGFQVDARRIVDLRDPANLASLPAHAGDPRADWRQAVGERYVPTSWRVRDWLEGRGALGLIDPSRQRPGLWHPVLFRWNRPGAPTVRP